jgi:hypothetical protein
MKMESSVQLQGRIKTAWKLDVSSYRHCTPSEAIYGEARRDTNPAISAIWRNVLWCTIVSVTRYRGWRICDIIWRFLHMF